MSSFKFCLSAVLLVCEISSFFKVHAFELRISTTDGYNPQIKSGLLQFQQQDQWFQVCEKEWTLSESRIACGQLGYPMAATNSRRRFGSNGITPQIRLRNVNCTGTESRLSECRHQITSSTEFNRCETPVYLTCVVIKRNSSNNIRLRGGPLNGQGRVQVVKYGKWGSICSNRWDSLSANVACRQLGYGTAKQIYKSTEFGRGHGAIWFTNVTCQGNEQTLEECEYNLIPNIGYSNAHEETGCSQYELASVTCHVPDDTQRSTVQLVGGSTTGRVVVKFGDRDSWRGICSEHWTIREAAVVCRQLGLGFASRAIRNIGFSRQDAIGTSATVTHVECRGDESSLSDCQYRIVNRGQFVNCGNRFRYLAFHVGVMCTNVLPDLQLDVDWLQNSIELIHRPIHELECAASEGCLSSSANALLNVTEHRNTTRQLLIFTTSAWNRGTADFRPWQTSEQWEFHQCHNHYHSMQQFSHYDLLSATTAQKVAEGHKASFCLGDSACDEFATRRYFCALEPTKNDQGISVGCTDIYLKSLDCQWIDMSDVEYGNYILRISLNPLEQVAESDFFNNDVICDLSYTKSGISADFCRIPDDYSLSG